MMHVAITGASSGLGEALAREFAKIGASVTLVARRRDILERIAGELGTKTFVATQDLTEPEHAADWVDAAEQALGPIDVLVSNAGLMSLGAFATLDPKEGDRMIAINFLSPLRLFQAVLPRMRARKRGTIVNVTSIAALVTVPGWSYQAASKAASATLSEALRTELEGSGVHVLTVYPGPTDTPMTRGGMTSYEGNRLASLLPLGTPAGFARRVRRAVEGRADRVFYPRFYGVVRWFPRISRWFMDRFAPRLD
jgi:short-subunit dehydrogenase